MNRQAVASELVRIAKSLVASKTINDLITHSGSNLHGNFHDLEKVENTLDSINKRLCNMTVEDAREELDRLLDSDKPGEKIDQAKVDKGNKALDRFQSLIDEQKKNKKL